MTSVGLRRAAGKPDASLAPLPAAGLDDLRQLILVSCVRHSLCDQCRSPVRNPRATTVGCVGTHPPAQGTQEPEEGGLAPAAPTLLDRDAWVQQARAELVELEGLGFDAGDVLRALGATPAAAGAGAQDALLEWLLLHVPPARLPAAFALQSVSTAGEVSVLQHSQREDPAVAGTAGPAPDAEAPRPAPAFSEPQAAAAAARPAVKGPEPACTGEAPRAGQDQKTWILRQLEVGSSDDERSGASSSPSSVEDWEVWGAPEEVAARKAEQTRRRHLTALPRDELVRTLHSQLQAALAAARAAKGGRDKSAQQRAGADVRQIKAEIAEAGITEAELEQAAASCAQSPEGRADGAIAEPLEGRADGAIAESLEGRAGSDASKSAADSELAGHGRLPSSGAATRDDPARQLAPAEEEEEGQPPGFDLFDVMGTGEDGAAGEGAARGLAGDGPPPRLLRLAQEKDRASARPAGAAAPQPRGKKAAPPPVPEQRPPKQVLMKYCQANGLTAPRYDRLEPGGGRNGGQVRLPASIGGAGCWKAEGALGRMPWPGPAARGWATGTPLSPALAPPSSHAPACQP